MRRHRRIGLFHLDAKRGNEELGGARQGHVIAERDIGPEGSVFLNRKDSEAEAVLFRQREPVDHPDAEILPYERADRDSEPRLDRRLILKPGAGENVRDNRPVWVARLDPNQWMGCDLRRG